MGDRNGPEHACCMGFIFSPVRNSKIWGRRHACNGHKRACLVKYYVMCPEKCTNMPVLFSPTTSHSDAI